MYPESVTVTPSSIGSLYEKERLSAAFRGIDRAEEDKNRLMVRNVLISGDLLTVNGQLVASSSPQLRAIIFLKCPFLRFELNGLGIAMY